MAIIPREIIDQARQAHPTFTPERHPDTLLLTHLSRVERRLVAKVVLLFPALVSDEETIELEQYDFAVGYLLPALHRIHGATAVFADGYRHRVDVVPWENRHHAGSNLAVYQQQGRIHLVGAAPGWRGVAQLVVLYTPIPEDFADEEEESVLPDTAESALIAELAHFMATRPIGADDAPPRAEFAAERARAENDFLTLVQRSRPAVRLVARPHW